MNTLTEKQHAHELIDHLDDSQIATALQLLESLAANSPPYTIANAPKTMNHILTKRRKL